MSNYNAHEDPNNNVPTEIEDEETEATPLSPAELLDKAMDLMPGRELLPYLSTIIYLRKYRDYSWRGIASWLAVNGNIKSSHTTVCNFYKHIMESHLQGQDEAYARECFEEVEARYHTQDQ
ncbi:hypothetical protein QEH59_11355 [Coraliomargarita sp. SDUM461004]|uniref:Uncharacterized protein n=1 Tax=Thalassobacterium sedimentorum TaxID=3041258 RepID=A0ABU1AJM5_9BACT|nr:hypothetical protein [Coraliomargarita sp. SDUM461004]MDQ8195026.1 hypothetical protein [Coraliomargarita sp. SDUM461004]